MDRLAHLQKLAEPLNPSADQRAKARNSVLAHTEPFLESLTQSVAFCHQPNGGLALDSMPIGEAWPIDQALDLLAEEVLKPGINGASPRHMGYIPLSSLYTSALGDYMAAIYNKYSAMFTVAPGAVRMEHQLLRWMTDLIGFPKQAGGSLTSGGSLAYLAAIVTAREAFAIKAQNVSKAVVYHSGEVHHALTKALFIAGLGEAIVRIIDCDPHHRMDPTKLAQTVDADRRAGYLPWLLVASAGTVNTGIIDPLADLAQVAQDQHLWLHVDAAYGGFFLLCDTVKIPHLADLRHADSVVLDPHKGLFVPAGLGALLVRDASLLAAAHCFTADYLQDQVAGDIYSPADLSPELTRHFRSPRLWLPLMVHGVAPFRAALEEKLLLARYFHQRLSELPGFELGPVPDLSIVFFRYLPAQADPDPFNQALHAALMASGRFLLSTTRIHNRLTLRLALLSFRTHLQEVNELIDCLLVALEQVLNSFSTT